MDKYFTLTQPIHSSQYKQLFDWLSSLTLNGKPLTFGIYCSVYKNKELVDRFRHINQQAKVDEVLITFSNIDINKLYYMYTENRVKEIQINIGLGNEEVEDYTPLFRLITDTNFIEVTNYGNCDIDISNKLVSFNIPHVLFYYRKIE